MAVIGGGVALALAASGNGPLGRIRHLSFLVWLVVIVTHLASYVPALPE